MAHTGLPAWDAGAADHLASEMQIVNDAGQYRANGAFRSLGIRKCLKEIGFG